MRVAHLNSSALNAIGYITIAYLFLTHVIITPGISASDSQRQNSKLGEHIFAFVGKAGSATMLITRLELENIKSYRNAVVDFRRDTTAISGPNGAGKTTLVDA